MTTGHKDDHENWRELARQIQQEKNPQKMIALVQQLIANFDQQQSRKTPPPKPQPRNRPGSPEV